jgi:hypothetical protein
VLDVYRPLRAAIRRVLALAPSACTRAEWMRAAKLIGLELDGGIAADSDDEMDFLTDIALFHPTARGSCAYDRFLRKEAQELDAPDRDLAVRIGGAFFSVFRVAGPHPEAGLWLDDLLHDRRRLWIVDEGLEASAQPGIAFATRLFDAGPFHAGFGIIVVLEDEAVAEYVAAVRVTGSPPGGARFPALIYGLEVQTRALGRVVQDLLDLAGPAPEEAPPRRRRQAARRPRKRATS